MYAYWITVNYREAYGIFACNGILFNHESPIRGETFVTRKITRALARIRLGFQDCLHLGNLDAKRDWGHARDYVEMQWLMLQQGQPDDFVIATGEQHSVREFVEIAANELGIQIAWEGRGLDEVGVVKRISNSDIPGGSPDTPAASPQLKKGQVILRIDPRYFRPTEVETLLGDPSKAKKLLGWEPKITFPELVSQMVIHDLEEARRDALCQTEGFRVANHFE